jgi:hypothetical protein
VVVPDIFGVSGRAMLAALTGGQRDPKALAQLARGVEPDYRKQLWSVLAAQLAPAGLLVFTWRAGGPPPRRPLQEIGSRQVGRHTYTGLLEILESDEEAFRARYLYRITEGEKGISEEEITGYAYRPVWDVIQHELVSAGFTQTEGAERLLAWRLT